VESKNLMQTSANICEVYAIKFASFALSTKLFDVICRPCKYIYHLAPHQTFIVICESKSVEKPPLQSPCRFINAKDTAALLLN